MGGFDASKVPEYLISYVVLIFSLTIHECSHAWAAWKLGDPTAKAKGRISLNPLVHMDPIGSVVFPLLAIFSHIPLLGWANPVPVNTLNLKNPRRDHAIIAALGPGSNLLYAVAFALVAKVIVVLKRSAALGSIRAFEFVFEPLLFIFMTAVLINLCLALFNLIPVPPLDGSWILEGVVPEEMAEKLELVRPYGFILLLVLFYTGIFGAVLRPFLGLFYYRLFFGFLGFH